MKQSLRWLLLLPIVLGVVIGMWRVLGDGFLPWQPEFWQHAVVNVRGFSAWLGALVDSIGKPK